MASNNRLRVVVEHAGRGFSLLEVLIAAVVLSLVTVPLFTSLHTGHQGMERIVEESLASNLGTSLLSKLSLVAFSKLPDVPTDTPDNELGKYFTVKADAPFIEPYPGDYRRLVTIEQVSHRTDDPGASENSQWGNLKLIKVKVVWLPDYLNRKSSRELVFQTLVSDDTEVW